MGLREIQEGFLQEVVTELSLKDKWELAEVCKRDPGRSNKRQFKDVLIGGHVACHRGGQLNEAGALGMRREIVRGLEGQMSKGWC